MLLVGAGRLPRAGSGSTRPALAEARAGLRAVRGAGSAGRECVGSPLGFLPSSSAPVGACAPALAVFLFRSTGRVVPPADPTALHESMAFPGL